MRPLPTISQVMSATRQEAAGAQKQAAAEPEKKFASEIAKGLHEIAEIVKQAADAPVTYDDVLNFGKGLLKGGQS